jgi:hypothetical protein
MKVTPVGKSFGKYKIGDEFELADKAANVFVKAGKLRKVEPILSKPTTGIKQMEHRASVLADLPRARDESRA